MATLSRKRWSCEMTSAQPSVAGEELLEPADREDVEVVGRLVEEEHVGPAEEHLREEHAQLEAARERRERLAGATRPGCRAPRGRPLARASSV